METIAGWFSLTEPEYHAYIQESELHGIQRMHALEPRRFIAAVQNNCAGTEHWQKETLRRNA